jgi:hypothetical protein
MTVKPDSLWPLTQSEKETRRMVWASTFGFVYWWVRNAPDNELRGDVSTGGRKKLCNFCRSQAVHAADEAAAAFEEHIQRARPKDDEDEESKESDLEGCRTCSFREFVAEDFTAGPAYPRCTCGHSGSRKVVKALERHYKHNLVQSRMVDDVTRSHRENGPPPEWCPFRGGADKGDG